MPTHAQTVGKGVFPSVLRKDKRDVKRQSKDSREEPRDKGGKAERRVKQKLDRTEGMMEMVGEGGPAATVGEK